MSIAQQQVVSNTRRTLLGVMNAADYYGLDELKHACSGFIQVTTGKRC